MEMNFPARLTPRQWLPRARLRLRRQLPPALRRARTCLSIRAPCSLLARGSSPRVPSVSDPVICNSVTVPCWVASPQCRKVQFNVALHSVSVNLRYHLHVYIDTY